MPSMTHAIADLWESVPVVSSITGEYSMQKRKTGGVEETGCVPKRSGVPKHSGMAPPISVHVAECVGALQLAQELLTIPAKRNSP
jgi:hypothetical protein